MSTQANVNKQLLAMVAIIMGTVVGVATGAVIASQMATSPGSAQSSAQSTEAAIHQIREQKAKEEQVSVFEDSRLYSICSPDGVAYWSRNSAWDARLWSMTPRYRTNGQLVQCDYESNREIVSQQ